MNNDPFKNIRSDNSPNLFDYDINTDPVARFTRWFITRFVWWVFFPIAIVGVCFFIYAALFVRVPHGSEQAIIEQKQINNHCDELEANSYKY